VFGNGFPGCIVQTGQFEDDALVLFRSDFAAEGVKMKLRHSDPRFLLVGKIVQRRVYMLPKDHLKC